MVPSRAARLVAGTVLAAVAGGLLLSVASVASGEESPPVVTVVASDVALTYGDAAPTSYAFTADGFLEGDGWVTEPACTSTYAVGAGVADSPLAITCSGGDAGPNYLVSYAGGELTVGPASVSVSTEDLALTYGDPAPTTYAFTADGFLEGDGWIIEPACTSTYAVGAGVADSPLAISCSGGDAGPNYVVSSTDGELTIAAKALAVTADDVALTYGDPAPTSYAFTAEGLVGDDGWITEPNCTSTYAAGTGVAESPLAISCSGGDAGPDYVVSSTDGALTIARRGVTVTAADASVTYGDPAPTYASTTTGFLGTDTWTTAPTCSSAYTATTPVSSSPVAITCSGGDAGANYEAISVAGNLTIARRTVTVTASDVARTYGDPVPAYPSTTTGFLGTDTWTTAPTCSSAYTATTPVASSPLAITCTGGNPGGNYATVSVAGRLTISRRPVSVRATDRTRVYGDPVPTYPSTATGFLGSDTWTTAPTCTSSYAPTTAVASSPLTVTCSGGNPGPNYRVSGYTAGSLSISRRPVTVTASARSVVYGEPEPAYGSTGGGLVNGDAWLAGPSCDADYAPGTIVGGYPIACTGEAGDNYAASFVGATLTVARRPLTVQADAPGKLVYGDPEPAFRSSVVAGGLAPGESWGTAPVCDSNYAKWNVVGSYTATCTFAANAVVGANGAPTTPNYDLRANGRVFDISSLPLTDFESAWFTGQNEYYTKSTAPSDGAVQVLLSATITGAFSASDCAGGASVETGTVSFVDQYTGYTLAKNIAITEVGDDCNEGIAAAWVTLTNGSDYFNQYAIRVLVRGSIEGDNFSQDPFQAYPGVKVVEGPALFDGGADTVTLAADPGNVVPNHGLRCDGDPVEFLAAPSPLSTSSTYYAKLAEGQPEPADTFQLTTGPLAAVSFSDQYDTVTLAGHGYDDGDRVSFTDISGPTGISDCTWYYVVNDDGVNTFQLSGTAGGDPIDLLGDGTGNLPYAGGAFTPVPFDTGTGQTECAGPDSSCPESFGETLVTVSDPVPGGALGNGTLTFLGPTAGATGCLPRSPWPASLGQEGRILSLEGGLVESECQTATFGVAFNTERKTPKGNAIVSIPDSGGVWLLKTNAVNTVSLNSTKTVAIITAKANVQYIPDVGLPIAYDGNVTTRIEVYEATNKIAFTFIGSKTSILWWSNDWYKSGKKWLTAPQALATGMVSVL